MKSNEEALTALSKLERSSRMAVPLGLLGVGAIVAMIVVSSAELRETRAEIATAERELKIRQEELAKVKAEAERITAETQKRLRETEQQLDNVTATAPAQAVALEEARNQLAVVDATLTRAKIFYEFKNAQPAAFDTMSVDIFYCESAGERAKQVATQLLQIKGESLGRWRVRRLSRNVNAGPSYRISGNVIRFNPDERSQAERLMQEGQRIAQVSFRLQEIDYPTPNYISAFICTE